MILSGVKNRRETPIGTFLGRKIRVSRAVINSGIAELLSQGFSNGKTSFRSICYRLPSLWYS